MTKHTMWFPNRSDTNRAIQAQEMVSLFRKKRKCTIRVTKTKALICVLVFAYAKCLFSHDAAQIIQIRKFISYVKINSLDFDFICYIGLKTDVQVNT